VLALRQHTASFGQGRASDGCLLQLRHFRPVDQGGVVGPLRAFELSEPRQVATETAKKSFIGGSELSRRDNACKFRNGSSQLLRCWSAVEVRPGLVDRLNVAIDPLASFVLGWRGRRARATRGQTHCERKRERDREKTVAEPGMHEAKASCPRSRSWRRRQIAAETRNQFSAFNRSATPPLGSRTGIRPISSSSSCSGEWLGE
jgi:hypothetical protein